MWYLLPRTPCTSCIIEWNCASDIIENLKFVDKRVQLSLEFFTLDNRMISLEPTGRAETSWYLKLANFDRDIEELEELEGSSCERNGNECALSKVVQLDIALQLLTQAQAFLRCVFTLFRPHLTSALLLSSEATLRGRWKLVLWDVISTVQVANLNDMIST